MFIHYICSLAYMTHLTNPCAFSHKGSAYSSMHQPQSTSQSVYLFPTFFFFEVERKQKAN